jgi:hypothetical protein
MSKRKKGLIHTDNLVNFQSYQFGLLYIRLWVRIVVVAIVVWLLSASRVPLVLARSR